MQSVELFQSERAYFDAHKAELLSRHRGQFAVIKGSRLVGVFDSDRLAYEAGYADVGNVPFLIREVTEEEPVVHVLLLDVAARDSDPR